MYVIQNYLYVEKVIFMNSVCSHTLSVHYRPNIDNTLVLYYQKKLCLKYVVRN